MKIACVQLNSNAAPAVNVGRTCEYIDRAVADHLPDLIVLPEFFNTLYFSQYRDYAHLQLAEREDGPSLSAVRERAARHGIHLVAPIFELDGPGRYFDTAFLIGPAGEIIGRYRKVHPAATSSLEKIYFRYGAEFPVWDVLGWKIGIAICYDTFFPESARMLSVQGAELLIFPFAGGTFPLWFELHRIRAFENLAYVAVCDKVGPEGDWTFGGKSLIASPLGDLLATASDTREEIIAATLDRDQVFAARVKYPMYRDRQPWAYGHLTDSR
ncbi:MAG: carbon-nitrogen hydrolase family protein [Thermoflexales bacterium]